MRGPEFVIDGITNSYCWPVFICIDIANIICIPVFVSVAATNAYLYCGIY